MRFVELYLDHPRIGCGVRRVFVTKEGRLKARLFYPPTCTAIDVPLRDLDKARDIDLPTRRDAARVAAMIRDTYKQRKRLHMAVAGRDAKASIEALRDNQIGPVELREAA